MIAYSGMGQQHITANDLLSQARKLQQETHGLPLRTAYEIAVTRTITDLECQLISARQSASVLLDHLQDLEHSHRDQSTAFAWSEDSCILCATCTKKTNSDKIPTLLYGVDWECDKCEARSWAGTVSGNERRLAGRNG